MRAVEQNADVPHEPIARERLLQKCVRPYFFSVCHVFGRTAVANDENGNEAQSWLTANVLTQLEARFSRQGEIEAHEIWKARCQDLDRRVVVSRRLHQEFVLYQAPADGLSLNRMIFDEHDRALGGFHRFSSRRAR
jgi:hypothetical protein